MHLDPSYTGAGVDLLTPERGYTGISAQQYWGSALLQALTLDWLEALLSSGWDRSDMDFWNPGAL